MRTDHGRFAALVNGSVPKYDNKAPNKAIELTVPSAPER